MSLFTFFITDKKNLTAAKKELFKIRQNSLSFIEDNSILMDTKLFQDQIFFSAIIVESCFSSFDNDEREYSNRFCRNNRSYLEASFQCLSKTQQISFGYFMDHKRKGFRSEIIITVLPESYQENVLYIIKS